MYLCSLSGQQKQECVLFEVVHVVALKLHTLHHRRGIALHLLTDMLYEVLQDTLILPLDQMSLDDLPVGHDSIQLYQVFLLRGLRPLAQ